MNTNGQEKQDPPGLSIRNALIGALYGLSMGTAFVLVAAMIDKWLHPEIPLGVDWSQTLMRWALIGLGLALVSAVTCIMNETLTGVLVGASMAGFLALGGTLLFTDTTAGMKLIVLIFTLAPMAVLSLPVVWVLRRLAQEHANASQRKWRLASVSLLVLISVALGAGSGYFTKMPSRTLEAVRLVHEGLRADGQHPEVDVSQLAGWQEHSGVRYELFQQKSESITEGFDVRAIYADGYIVLCTVNAYPGYEPFIKECKVVEK